MARGKTKNNEKPNGNNKSTALGFEALPISSKPIQQAKSEVPLCIAFSALEESPWGEWRLGKPISARGIANLLKPYDIRPRRDRANNAYLATDFQDAFKRYLTKEREESSANSTSSIE